MNGMPHTQVIAYCRVNSQISSGVLSQAMMCWYEKRNTIMIPKARPMSSVNSVPTISPIRSCLFSPT